MAKHPSLLSKRIEEAQRRAKICTREEFRLLTGLSNGTFYAVQASGRVGSASTLQRLKKAGVRVPIEALPPDLAALLAA